MYEFTFLDIKAYDQSNLIKDLKSKLSSLNE